MKNLLYPPALIPGDKVAITAPSSPVSSDVLAKAVHSIEYLCLKPVVMPSCKMNCGYLSGSDIQRAEDINTAFRVNEIKGIFCLRGGFGAMRILAMLDFEMIKKNPKIFIGYSDITALHTAINNLCGFITFHGPMPSIDYTSLDEFSLDSLKKSIFYNKNRPTILTNPEINKLQTLYCGKSSGILTGGNLSLLTGTLGSQYEIDTKGKILFIEEVEESLYKIDRSLTTLGLADKFNDCSGIIFGTFNACAKGETANLKEILKFFAHKYEKPCVFNLRAGHVYPQLTLPLGAYIELNASKHSAAEISVL